MKRLATKRWACTRDNSPASCTCTTNTGMRSCGSRLPRMRSPRYSWRRHLLFRLPFSTFTMLLLTTIITNIQQPYCLAVPGGTTRNTHHQSRHSRQPHHTSQKQPKQKQQEPEECYYKILGVTKGSIQDNDDNDNGGAEALKKAYRRASLRHHPDKPGGNEETFKRLSRAYEVLSDPEKRRIYDQYGAAGLEGGGGAGSASAFGMNPQHSYHQYPFGSRSRNAQSTPFTQFYSSSSSSSSPSPSIDPNDILRHFTSSSFSSTSSSARQNNMFGNGGGGFGGLGGGGGGGGGLEDLLAQMMGGGRGGVGGGGLHGGGGSDFSRPRHGQQRHQQPREIKSYTRDLPCTLSELFLGSTKKVKVTFPPHLLGGSGNEILSHVYTIQLVKGWKAGTKVTFPPPTTKSSMSKNGKFIPVRMTFVITEAATAALNNNEATRVLRRSGNDLIFRYQLDSPAGLQKKTFVDIAVPLLPDGKQVWKRSIPTTSSILRPGQKLTVPDLGMPIKGGPQRGNLIIEFY